MFSSVLIANRGEIAVRIARTAKKMGLRTIAVYSDAEPHALHVRLCDAAYRLGPAPARESYLNVEKLVAIAKRAGADCVHPGYGFLAESPDLAEACARAGLVFIGPPPAAMRVMGLKDRAKALMDKAGVPVLPGYHGERQEATFLKQKAYEIGYPVLIKAVAGGGGKGMRRVDKHAEFEAALEAVVREASAAFGDARVLLEKYVEAPRHVEVQIFADAYGNIIHLNERDCSLQRRHQKVIEEAPAPGMTSELRALIGQAAIEVARAVDYVGAGTVEFIADGTRGLRAGGFWFIEMNTRLQVEHPVTEAITGVDLVEWQFRVAAGERLPLRQEQVPLHGHAVEARLYAEDPERGFVPSTGKIIALELPAGEGLRVDSGVEAGDQVTPYYDPLIAKVIAHATTREAALDKLALALERTIVAGPRSNVALLAMLARADALRSGKIDTDFIDRHLKELGGPVPGIDQAAAAAGAAAVLQREQARTAARIGGKPPQLPSPWDATDGFQLAGTRRVVLPIVVNNEIRDATITYEGGTASVTVDGVAAAPDARVIEAGDAIYVLRRGRQTVVRRPITEMTNTTQAEEAGLVRAPMHGKVLEVNVAPGQAVHRGQRLVVIEAMKMEHALTAPFDGVVTEVSATAGGQVAEGAVLLTIMPTV